jgi:hypothetical protein
MCKNPFGGNARLDRIDFMDYASGTDSPFKLLYLKVISDAANNYLYFGFGDNHTVPDEFWYATEYFFTCRSYLKETWEHAKFMRHAYFDETLKKHVSTSIMLSDEELRLSCFDHHYEIAELDRLMPIQQFESWLRRRREELLAENRDQVNTYIDLLQATSMLEIQGGQQMPFKLDTADRMQILVRPECPEQVAEMVFYAPRYRTCARRAGSTRARRELACTAPCRGIVAQPGQQSFALV